MKWMQSKKTIAILMLTVFISFCVPTVVSAQPETDSGTADTAYAEFGYKAKCVNLKAVMGTKSTVSTYNENGRSGWILKEATSASSQININLDDGFAYRNTNGTSYTVEVDYLNLENGHFNILYDSYDMTNKETKITYIGNTGEWKTAVYELDDAYFGNRTDSGGDLRITTMDQSLTRGGSANVVIGAVRVIRHNAKNFVQILSVDTDVAGNIFGNGEEQKFDTEIINNTDKIKQATVRFEALDENNKCVWSDEYETVIEGNKTTNVAVICDVSKYGLYNMRVTANGDKFEHSKTVPFSLVNNRLDGKKHSMFGYQAGFTNNIPGHKYEYKKALELYEKAGVSFIRDSMIWNKVDPANKRKYTCEITDQYREIYDAIAKSKLDIAALMGLYGPNKYDGLLSTTHMPITEDAMKGYAEFCKFYASICKERGINVLGYEVWNEPEMLHFNKNATLAQVSEIAVNASKALNEVDPDAPKKTSVSFCAGPYVDTYPQGLSANGYADWCRALICHTYHNNSYPEDQKVVQYMRDYIKIYEETLGKKPVVTLMTEYGRNRAFDKSKNEEDKARLIMRDSVFIQKSGLFDKLSWYTLNQGGREDHGEDTYGDVASDNAAITDVPFAATHTYVAKANYNNIMCEADYDKALADEVNGANAYLFNRPDASVMAVWTADKTKKFDTFSFKSDAESITVYDMYGNSETVYGNNGVFSLCITGQIIYIVGNVNDAKVCDAPFKIKGYQPEVASDSVLDIEIENMPNGSKISINENDNVKNISDTGEFKSYSVIKIKVVGNSGQKNTIDLYMTKDNKICYIYKLPIEVTNSVLCSTDALPVSLNDLSQWNLMVEISNQKTGSTISGDIELIEPASWANKIKRCKFKEIPGNATAVAKVPISRTGTEQNTYVKYKVHTDNGQEYLFSDLINFDSGLYVTVPPVIDGILNEGEWYPGIALRAEKDLNVHKFTDSWGGVNDLSAKIMLEIDENNVYFAGDVTDDVMSATSSGEQIWQNDSIQIGIAFSDAAKESEFYGDTFTEIAIGDSPEGAIAWRHRSVNNSMPACKLDSANVAVKRIGQHTYYEACIPLKEIFDMEVDGSSLNSLKLSVAVNDNDGNGRTQALQIGGGIVTVKDLKQFRVLNILRDNNAN